MAFELKIKYEIENRGGGDATSGVSGSWQPEGGPLEKTMWGHATKKSDHKVLEIILCLY